MTAFFEVHFPAITAMLLPICDSATPIIYKESLIKM